MKDMDTRRPVRDSLHRVNRQPSLTGLLVSISVITWLMKDGDTDFAVLINVRVPHLCEDPHHRGPQGVLFGEQKVTFEEASFVQCVRGSNYQNFPSENVFIVYETG